MNTNMGGKRKFRSSGQDVSPRCVVARLGPAKKPEEPGEPGDLTRQKVLLIRTGDEAR
jgi:hypothetical protein